MEIIGYKCFNEGLINNHNIKFEVGKKYVIKPPIKFGTKGNGFHLCKRMEDTLRYFNALEENIDMCLVRGSGQIDKQYDEYYGYYDMYAVEELEILKQLSRDEIIEIALNLNDLRVCRFIQSFKLNASEIELFKRKFQNYESVLNHIKYYQEKETEVFVKKRGGLYG